MLSRQLKREGNEMQYLTENGEPIKQYNENEPMIDYKLGQLKQEIQESINTLYETYREIDFNVSFEGYKTMENNHVIVSITASI